MEIASVNVLTARFKFANLGVIHFKQENICRTYSSVIIRIKVFGVECHAADGRANHLRQVLGGDDELAFRKVVEKEDISRDAVVDIFSVIHGEELPVGDDEFKFCIFA